MGIWVIWIMVRASVYIRVFRFLLGCMKVELHLDVAAHACDLRTVWSEAGGSQ